MTTPTPRNGLHRRLADALLPPIAWFFCRMVGLLAWVLTSRRKDTIRNVALAFPEKDARWHRRIAFKSVLRMFEMFVVPVVVPFLSEGNLRRRFHFTQQALAILDRVKQEGPAIMQTPHCASSETMAIAPMLYPGIQFTSIYRPLDLHLVDKLVIKARTLWGMKLISRKEGLLGINHSIAKGECVCILFDQNTLTSGALILSFNRVCMATDLPGILASRLKKPTYLVHAKRTGFLRAAFDIASIQTDGSAAEITATSSLMLEKALRGDDELCADWMWAHRRWKNHFCRVNQFLSLAHKKDYLDVSLRLSGLSALPRRQPCILRAPNDPALAEKVAGWMPKLREARPDIRWIVLAEENAARFFCEGENCERLVTFKFDSFRQALQSLRNEYAEIYLPLEPGTDAEKERLTSGSQRALGIIPARRKNKGGTVYFEATAERFQPSAFDELLRDVFGFCGLGK
jgi:lauroyl/myristoyl acyltransferase